MLSHRRDGGWRLVRFTLNQSLTSHKARPT